MNQTRPVATLLSKAEVARRLSVSSKTVSRLIDHGMLRHHRIGHQIRISEDDLRNYIAQARH